MAKRFHFSRWNGLRIGLAVVALRLLASDCSRLPATNCETATAVTEIPLGAADGHNTTFFLHFAPSNAAPVTVFLNGILLANTDYVLQDRKITFPPEHAPQTGDNLQVAYLPLPGRAGVSSGLESLPTNGSELGLNKNDDLTRSAIREALDGEVRRLGQRSTKAERTQQEGPEIPTDGPEMRTLSSIKLLSSRLHGKTVRNSHPRSTSRPTRAVEAAGVDGLGDTPLPSSLELPSDPAVDSLPGNETLRRTSTQAHGPEEQETGSPSAPSLASLRLLGRKLHEKKESRSRAPEKEQYKQKGRRGADSPKQRLEDDEMAQ